MSNMRISDSKNIEYDVGILYEHWVNGETIDYERKCRVCANEFGSVQNLYADICRFINSQILLDMMPLIDEYLAYYEGL